MNKILPVSYPLITMYPGYATMCSILQNYPETYNWMYSQYIQIYIYNDADRAKGERSVRGSFFSDYDSREYSHLWQSHIFIKHRLCPFLRTNSLITDLALGDKDTFVSLVKKCIDNEFYVYVELLYQPISSFIQTEDNFKHELLIFGYDDTKGTFYIADYYFKDVRKYHWGECSYKDIEMASQAIRKRFGKNNHEIALIQFDPSIRYPLNYSYVCAQIDAYLHPNKQIACDFSQFVHDRLQIKNPIVCIGNDMYSYLAQFAMKELELGNEYIDFRMYHGLFDHKIMMSNRMKYLIDQGYKKRYDETILREYNVVVKEARIIRNKIIKYNMCHKESIIYSLSRQLERMKHLENDILQAFFESRM